jgi:hypothetical protein
MDDIFINHFLFLLKMSREEEPLYVPGGNAPLGAPTGMQGQRQVSSQSRVETPYVPPTGVEAVMDGLKLRRQVERDFLKGAERRLAKYERDRDKEIDDDRLHYGTVYDYRMAYPDWIDRSRAKVRQWEDHLAAIDRWENLDREKMPMAYKLAVDEALVDAPEIGGVTQTPRKWEFDYRNERMADHRRNRRAARRKLAKWKKRLGNYANWPEFP